MIRYAALRTPAGHLDILVEPPDAAVSAARAAGGEVDALRVLDTTAGALRRALCARLGLPPGVVLAGHQAEFFHGGVFAKLLALGPLAARLGAAAVFLTVDSDTPKATEVGAPPRAGAGVERRAVQIPGLAPQHAVETQPLGARKQWESFFSALREVAHSDAAASLDAFRHGWLSAVDTGRIADSFFGGHSAVLTVLGHAAPRHLSVSQLSQTPEFAALLGHWLQHAGTFAEAYNDAQARYRARHRVRSPQRPVPRLATRGPSVETPYWALSADGLRARLFVAPGPGVLRLLADEEAIGTLEVRALRSTAGVAAALSEATGGWRIRPRALALSAFVRLVLSDLFVHGIGGAKYDELTDDFMTTAFGRPPRPIACVSATLRLPGAETEARSTESVRALRHALRDAEQNPQRRLDDLPPELVAQRAALVQELVRLREEDRRNRDARREAHRALRAVNESLQRHGAAQIDALRKKLSSAEARDAASALAAGREYFYAFAGLDALLALDGNVSAAISS